MFRGVAVLLSGAHGPRILKATFQTKKQKINMDVIQCYTKTEGTSKDVKEEFYSRLSTIIGTTLSL